MWRREELEEIHFHKNVKWHLEFSGKLYRSPYNFEKIEIALGWPNSYKLYSAA